MGQKSCLGNVSTTTTTQVRQTWITVLSHLSVLLQPSLSLMSVLTVQVISISCPSHWSLYINVLTTCLFCRWHATPAFGGRKMREVIKTRLGEEGGCRRVHRLEALLVINSPIFSLRLVYMTVGASSHFASFVLEQVLDTLSFAGQLHFEIIVHFSPLFGLSVPAPSFI